MRSIILYNVLEHFLFNLSQKLQAGTPAVRIAAVSAALLLRQIERELL